MDTAVTSPFGKEPYSSLLGMGAADQLASLSVMMGLRRFTACPEHVDVVGVSLAQDMLSCWC